MKKVMIGILILIPVLILLVVAAVSSILSLAAWIAVDNMTLISKSTGQYDPDSIEVVFSDDVQTYNFYDYLKVVIEPVRANRYSIEWRLSDVQCMDAAYDASIQPPAMLVDNKGYEVESNTTGKFVIRAYCRFTLTVQAEHISKHLAVTVEGYDVESIKITDVEEGATGTMKLGESKRVDAVFTPMSSIVTKTRWQSSDERVATVDGNGVITAVGIGNANITVEANRHDDENVFVTSEVYSVEVVANASKYGGSITTAKRTVILSEIGLLEGDIVSCNGCTVKDNAINITADNASIETKNGTLNLSVCEEGGIAIANADKFDTASGYVFALGEITLNLKAVWEDMLAQGDPSGVDWTSSNARVATVDENGVVTAKSVGQVRIIATKGGKSASVLLNVQNKVVSMQLRTSNYSFVVGLARETVFAAEKYADATVDNTKIANSKQIEIVGAPLMEEDEDIQDYKARLAQFYSAYSFEVVGGNEYATIGGEYGNTLTFIPSALDGKGRQIVTVKVSAKYPKYENAFTHDTVDVNVVYGVEVNDCKELRTASADQKEYAFKDGNLIESELAFEHFNTANGRNDRYRVYNYQRSNYTYAISFAADVAIEGGSIGVYGNVYGNNYKFYAEANQMSTYSPMFYVYWSNVTISNLNIRANGISDNGTITSDETTGFTGQCVYVGNENNVDKARIINTRIEYCILENACRSLEVSNADVIVEGSIMRNISNAAIYIRTTMMTYFEDDGIRTTFPRYGHLDLKNNVFSNCLATIGAFGYETYTYMPKKSANQSDELYDYSDDDVPSGVGRFVRDDLDANARYFRENFASKGINTSVNQTGFIDVYNWQNIENANLVGDLGDATLNSVVTAASGSLLKTNSTFSSALYRDKEDTYLHMGFITMGILFSQGIFSEPSYLDIRFEDRRFAAVISTKGMPQQCTDFMGSNAEKFLTKAEIKYYSYTAAADIKPDSTYVVNWAMIAHLHGER